MSEWIERDPDWLDSAEAPPEREVVTVTQAMRILSLEDRRDFYALLALDPEDSSAIPFFDWFKLPSGHIRIYADAVFNVLSR